MAWVLALAQPGPASLLVTGTWPHQSEDALPSPPPSCPQWVSVGWAVPTSVCGMDGEGAPTSLPVLRSFLPQREPAGGGAPETPLPGGRRVQPRPHRVTFGARFTACIAHSLCTSSRLISRGLSLEQPGHTSLFLVQRRLRDSTWLTQGHAAAQREI